MLYGPTVSRQSDICRGSPSGGLQGQEVPAAADQELVASPDYGRTGSDGRARERVPGA